MAKHQTPHREMYARRAAELDYMNRDIEAYDIDRAEKRYLDTGYKTLRKLLAEKLMTFANKPNTRKIRVFIKKQISG